MIYGYIVVSRNSFLFFIKNLRNCECRVNYIDVKKSVIKLID